MKKVLLIGFIGWIILCGCLSKTSDQSHSIVSMQIIDRNGFTETISNKERLSSYQGTDFLKPQPYQKVLRVYGRNLEGQSTSKITSYHDNGLPWQYLEVVDGRAHGIYREWFPNGQLKLEAYVIEGIADIHELAQATWVFEGESKAWDDEGHLVAEFFYEKGLLHTSSRYYFPDGKLHKIIPYDQGEIHGVAQAFNEQGELVEEISYVRGEKQGDALSYWNLKELRSKETYERDTLQNAVYYDASGRLVAEVKDGQGKAAQFKEKTLYQLTCYTNGVPEGDVQIFYPNGTLHLSYFIKNGKKAGEEWEYYPSQEGKSLSPKLCLHWHDDRIEGQVKTWYPNGQLESQREMSGNKKQGISFAWYKNGDLMLMEEYANDLLIKGSYYKKGNKKTVSKIEGGKGIATLYTADGLFLKKISYEKGKPYLNNNDLP